MPTVNQGREHQPTMEQCLALGKDAVGENFSLVEVSRAILNGSLKHGALLKGKRWWMSYQVTSCSSPLPSSGIPTLSHPLEVSYGPKARKHYWRERNPQSPAGSHWKAVCGLQVLLGYCICGDGGGGHAAGFPECGHCASQGALVGTAGLVQMPKLKPRRVTGSKTTSKATRSTVLPCHVKRWEQNLFWYQRLGKEKGS